MDSRLPPKPAFAGPLDGLEFTTPFNMLIVVMVEIGGGFTSKEVKPLIQGPHRLPKKYRDDPRCLGHYRRTRFFNSQKEEYIWTSKYRVRRAFMTKEEMDRAIEEMERNNKKNQKPGWMVNADELDQDYYGESDPADDWKK